MGDEREKSDAPAELVSDDLFGGDIRLAGHRIRIYDFWVRIEMGLSVDDILVEWPYLRREQVELAVEYAENHPHEMQATEYLQDAAEYEHRAEELRRAAEWIGSECPRCGEGDLVETEVGPATLFECSSCGQQTFADRRGESVPIGQDDEK